MGFFSVENKSSAPWTYAMTPQVAWTIMQYSKADASHNFQSNPKADPGTLKTSHSQRPKANILLSLYVKVLVGSMLQKLGFVCSSLLTGAFKVPEAVL